MTDKDKKPLISVIVPVYKVGQYLDECVSSIVNQTYANLEIILVDDGSPDECPLLCDKWAEKDSRIKVIHKSNGGLSSARNAGLKAAKGDYVGFVDSDDYIGKKMYEKLFDGFKVCDNVGVTSVMVQKDEEGKISPYQEDWMLSEVSIVSGGDFTERMITQASCHTAWNKLYLSALAKKVSFFEGRNNEDTLYMYELGKLMKEQNYSLVEIPYSAYYYRIRPNSICSVTSKPLFVDIISNTEFMLLDNKDEMLNKILSEMYVKQLFVFLDAIVMEKNMECKYYETYKLKLRKIPKSNMKKALGLKGFVLAWLLLYCPKLRFFIKKK